MPHALVTKSGHGSVGLVGLVGLLAVMAELAAHLPGGAEGCFITNCPAGGRKRNGLARSLGKRSGGLQQPVRECARCGPAGFDGRCFGPELCCAADGTGCLPPGLEAATESCLREAAVPFPCLNVEARPCDAVESGQCVSTGLCCNGNDQCASSPKECPPPMPAAPRTMRERVFEAMEGANANLNSVGSGSWGKRGMSRPMAMAHRRGSEAAWNNL